MLSALMLLYSSGQVPSLLLVSICLSVSSQKQSYSDIFSSRIVQNGAEQEVRQFAPKLTTVPGGNSFSSNQ